MAAAVEEVLVLRAQEFPRGGFLEMLDNHSDFDEIDDVIESHNALLAPTPNQAVKDASPDDSPEIALGTTRSFYDVSKRACGAFASPKHQITDDIAKPDMLPKGLLDVELGEPVHTHADLA